MRKGTHPSWTLLEWDEYYRDCIRDYYISQQGCVDCECRYLEECQGSAARCEDFIPSLDAWIEASERADYEWACGFWRPLEPFIECDMVKVIDKKT